MARIVDEIFRERFMLRRAERRARSYSDAQRDEIRLLSRAAKSRMSAAASLRSPGELGAAFSLLREALALWVTATRVASGEHEAGEVLSVPDAWAHLRDVGEASEELEAILATPNPTVGDALPTEDALRLRPLLEAELSRLSALVEVRSVRGIRIRRVLRLATVGLAVAFLLVATLAWAFAPPNVARGKRVRASSHWPGTPDPSGLTDGVRGHGYGAHTQIQDEPWVELDLGRTFAVREVVVYHRSDGLERESLPLTLELSEDQTSWAPVATQTRVFTADRPWRVSLPGRRARFVRLVIHQKGYIALSEIEVYGAPV